MLKDIVKSVKPVWLRIKGEFRPRGGISSTIEVSYPQKK
jgi:7-cyano-7-deazaguanine reductase